MTELDKGGFVEITIAETKDGSTLTYREASGIRLYRGAGQLRRLAQLFIPGTFGDVYGSGYGDPIIEHQLAGFAIIGRTGSYYGLDVDGINAYVEATGGIVKVKDGDDLPDTIKVQLASGSHVYFPTIKVLDKFGVQRKPAILKIL